MFDLVCRGRFIIHCGDFAYGGGSGANGYGDIHQGSHDGKSEVQADDLCQPDGGGRAKNGRWQKRMKLTKNSDWGIVFCMVDWQSLSKKGRRRTRERMRVDLLDDKTPYRWISYIKEVEHIINIFHIKLYSQACPT